MRSVSACLNTFLPGGEREPGDPEVSVVPGARDLRAGDLREAESVEGDVGGEDGEEQDNQLRARVRS